MRKLLVAALSLAFLVSVGGCKHHDDDMDDADMGMSTTEGRSGTSQSRAGSTAAGADQCSHCQGVQKLNADGTCPQCKAKVK